MQRKGFWFGILAGAVLLVLTGIDLVNRYRKGPASLANQTGSPASPQATSYPPVAMSSPSPLSSITPATPRQTISPAPAVRASSTPSSTPAPLASPHLPDYFPTDINIFGAHGDHVTFDLRNDMSGLIASASFRNSTIAEGSGDLRLHIYVNGALKVDESKPKFAESVTSYSYRPPADPGTYTVKFVLNEQGFVAESDLGNNTAVMGYTINPDRTPPTFEIDGPYLIDGQTCMRWIKLEDNVSVYTDVWAEWKIDDGQWSERSSGTVYGCATGESGSSHLYIVRAQDKAGNVREDALGFSIF